MRRFMIEAGCFLVEGMDLRSVLVTVMPILRHLMLHFHCFRTMPVLG